MKRSHSDCETDDIYSGDEKESEESGCGGVSRKRRRGIIEKRRRDRINNSLAELRRLVPAAYEKQGSAKLEKAEILQMTVDHLKLLHAKGVDALSYDTNKIALDYHSIGFRECSAEVARYLVAVEGLDLQDPLRLRLLSHLQCYVAQHHQRNASSWMTWGSPAGSSTATHHPSSAYGSPSGSTALGGSNSAFQNHSVLSSSHHGTVATGHTVPTHLDQSHMSAFSAPHSSTSTVSVGDLASCGLTSTSPAATAVGSGSLVPQLSQRLPTTAAGAPHIPHVSMATAAASSQSYHSSTSYHLNLNAFPGAHHHNNLIPNTSSPLNISTTHVSSSPNLSSSSSSLLSQQQGVQQQVHSNALHGGYSSSIHAGDSKPYRPWGAEIAY